MIDTGGAAFAKEWETTDGKGIYEEGHAFDPKKVRTLIGATWLDVCAWHAMQTLLMRIEDWRLPAIADSIAEDAYDIAMAMLREKRKREKSEAT